MVCRAKKEDISIYECLSLCVCVCVCCCIRNGAVKQIRFNLKRLLMELNEANGHD